MLRFARHDSRRNQGDYLGVDFYLCNAFELLFSRLPAFPALTPNTQHLAPVLRVYRPHQNRCTRPGAPWMRHPRLHHRRLLGKGHRHLMLDAYVRLDAVEHKTGRNVREFFRFHFVQASPVHSAFRGELRRCDAL
jgi:hypothetical protein